MDKFKLKNYIKLNCFFFFLKDGKLQITPLKYGGNWILYPEISEFEFYPLKFGDVWILHPDLSKFEFYPHILGVFGFYSLKFWSI